MSASSYWRVSMEAILDEAGVSVTPKQFADIVSGVEGAAEMESEATGHLCIPDPRETEIAALKRRITEEQARADQNREDFVTNVCTRWNVAPHQVMLDGPDATIYP